MNSSQSHPTESLYDSQTVLSLPFNSLWGENHVAPESSRSSFLVRTARRVSRARWFTFLRRVFHYQNASRSDLGSNPFHSITWLMLEFITLAAQISVITFTLAISKNEQPVWPVRVWVVGYDVGCLLNLMLLFGKYRELYGNQENGFRLGDLEQQSVNEDSRCLELMNKCRKSLELFFAIWFVVGNVWVFDSRLDSFHRAPKLHVLCISLLTWNAVCYAFPFILFLLLCCCVPLMGSLIGYNMNAGSTERGASDDQISRLPCLRYKKLEADAESCSGKDSSPIRTLQDPECCICLSKYKDKEEVRQLPCSHVFHLKCVDQWLRIISCCPLCKQQLDN